MKYYKKLVGKRIYLSPINVEDAEKYVEWFCDFRTTDGIGKSGSIVTVASERAWMEEKINRGEYCFAIIDLETDELIGNCGLMHIQPKDRNAELGIFIGKEQHRSKGYGTEVIQILLDYGFHYLNLHNIYLGVMAFNERAIRCYQKIGFKECGRRRETYFLNGKYYDCIFMDMLENEFRGDYIQNKNR